MEIKRRVRNRERDGGVGVGKMSAVIEVKSRWKEDWWPLMRFVGGILAGRFSFHPTDRKSEGRTLRRV